MINESTHAINLSYVLHERSDSRQVRRACRTGRRFEERRESLVQRLDRLTDEQFARSLHIAPDLGQALRQSASPGMILTAHLGLPHLLPRAVQIARRLDPGSATPLLERLDDEPGPAEELSVQLFQGRASLPVITTTRDQFPVLAAGLVVRPGRETLQLTGSLLTDDALQGGDSLAGNAAVQRTLESLLRDFVDQWYPPRALWERPAEDTLAELAAAAPPASER